MEEKYEYVGILRCRTWHTWPAPVLVDHKSLRFLNGSTEIIGRIVVLSYAQRTTPELYPEEETKKGLLLWDGKVTNLHTVRDVIIAAPQDQFPVAFRHRHAHRGEVDVCINFILENPITPSVVEEVKSFVYAEMAMLNLQLGESLVPTVPFQISHVLGNDERSLDSTVFLKGAVRKELQQAEIETALRNFVSLLVHEELGRHALVALELYAAHFSEKHARVRFLLLVIALEALAAPTQKHKAALDCLNRWEKDLAEQLALHNQGSDEYKSLEALRHGLRFQRTDSIRSRVQNLFTHLADLPDEVQVLRFELGMIKQNEIFVQVLGKNGALVTSTTSGAHLYMRGACQMMSWRTSRIMHVVFSKWSLMTWCQPLPKRSLKAQLLLAARRISPCTAAVHARERRNADTPTAHAGRHGRRRLPLGSVRTHVR